MLPVTGYADRWSVRQGETIGFSVGVAGGGPYRARVARVLCGDPNPAGPGYREVAVPWSGEGEYHGEERVVATGSWVDVPPLDAAPGPIEFAATIWPTRIAAAADTTERLGGRTAAQKRRPITHQAVLDWGALTLGIGPSGAYTRLGDTTVETGVALTERAWHDLSCRYDPATGRLSVTQVPHRPRLDRDERATADCAAAAVALGGPVAIAARRIGAETGEHFNGKIERPRITGSGAVLAAWDFAGEMSGDIVTDTGPRALHGRCVNLPTRAMTGSNWTGALHRWTEDPAQWGAIHFHDDDVGDAGWPVSLRITVPPDWPSSVYALHLETDGGRDNIVFYVRAAVPGSQARVAFLAPTLTYTVYGQFQRPGKQAEIAGRARAWSALSHTPDGHPEYGVSPYNHHSDGSGVVMSSTRRPLIDKRVNQFILMDPHPDGSGTYWIAADSYLTDLLDREGVGFEVITDHDVHAEGAELLRHYDLVITGQHPEYHTTQTLDAIAFFLGAGGRFIYLGGNGFYWKVVPLGDGPWALELRRAEGGIRLWETLPGESYHAFDGSYGGLWRRLGRPPQALVGVGFSTQGEYRGFPYRFTDGILDPRVAFMRDGIDAVPGAQFGERGLMGGGAAGHELDRADVRLGTPPHALVVGRAVVEHETYQPVNEERFDHTWPGPREEIIRSDLTFFETSGGGAVFSVGSMNYIGALPIDGYQTVAARLLVNVIRRFADPAPLLLT